MGADDLGVGSWGPVEVAGVESGPGKQERPHSFRCHGRPMRKPAEVGAFAAVLLFPATVG